MESGGTESRGTEAEGSRAEGAIDLDWVRGNFPALALLAGGRQAVYFDNPAGTQVPERTISGIADYLRRSNANTHGSFETSRRTDDLIRQARAAMAALLGAASADEIAFGPNMTTLTYALSRALARRFRPGDEVIVSDLDHDANVAPWLELEQHGVVVRRIPLLQRDCTLDLEAFERLLSPRTRLVAVGYASNAVGTINDVQRIVELSHRAGALVWIDAVHYAPHAVMDVQALEADFLVCSAYKFFGPHLGVLWGRASLLEEIAAYQVRPAPQAAPEKFETGTKNHECISGLLETVAYLRELGRRSSGHASQARAELVAAFTAIQRHEARLGAALCEGLLSVPGLSLYGIREPERWQERVPTFAFTLAGVASHAVAQQLGERGIFTWAGNYYALTLMQRLGLEGQGGAVRAGAVHYNSLSEVERLVAELKALKRQPAPPKAPEGAAGPPRA